MAVCSEDPSLERIVRGDNAHLFPHYDPLFAAKFAYGPPKMSRELLQAIADRQPLLYSASQGKTMLADKLREVNILGDTVSLSIVCVPANIAVFVHLPALQTHLSTDERPRQGGVLRHGRGAERRPAASGSHTWGLWTQVRGRSCWPESSCAYAVDPCSEHNRHRSLPTLPLGRAARVSHLLDAEQSHPEECLGGCDYSALVADESGRWKSAQL